MKDWFRKIFKALGRKIGMSEAQLKEGTAFSDTMESMFDMFGIGEAEVLSLDDVTVKKSESFKEGINTTSTMEAETTSLQEKGVEGRDTPFAAAETDVTNILSNLQAVTDSEVDERIKLCK